MLHLRGTGALGHLQSRAGCTAWAMAIFTTPAPWSRCPGKGIGLAPEPSFGTHFFQDLVEANIYPLAVYLDDEDVVFNRDFFYKTPNQLAEFAARGRPRWKTACA